MIKILSVPQIRKADLYTIENEPITSINLMERAAKACVDQLKMLQTAETNDFCIFCGPGNNGGDGAAIARLLVSEGLKVKVYIPDSKENISNDLQQNIIRLKEVGLSPFNIQTIDFEEILPEAVLIDALFGSGLSKPLEGFYKELVTRINKLPNIKISIDIPTGLFADKATDNLQSTVLKADYTFSFQFPKLAFLFPENEFFVGDWRILNIGLHEEFIRHEDCNHFLIEHSDIAQLYNPRHRFAHKGSYGHALLMGGSRGKVGAAILMSRACIRSGVGLVSVAIPNCALDIIQISAPEAMAIPDNSNEFLSTLPDLTNFSSVAFGPGAGTDAATAKLLKLLIQQEKVPIVLDADALNILADNPTWLAFLPAGTILTPHPGEFKRLVGNYSNSYERLEMLKAFCIRYKLYIILKGAFTTICTPHGNCYFNPTGNPGMATGGSGDTLTGILAGLLAMNYSMIDACLIATYIHGYAGDVAAEKEGFESLTASDIIDNLGIAFLDLKN